MDGLTEMRRFVEGGHTASDFKLLHDCLCRYV